MNVEVLFLGQSHRTIAVLREDGEVVSFWECVKMPEALDDNHISGNQQHDVDVPKANIDLGIH